VIEALKDFPDNVIAIACHGHVTKADYETVLIPDIEDKLSRHKKVRIYCEIAPDYVGLDPGAVWEDTKVGFFSATSATGNAPRWSLTWNG
jgi:hypothetical protein